MTSQNNRQNAMNFYEGGHEEFINLTDIQNMYEQNGKQYYSDFNMPQPQYQHHSDFNMPNINDIPLSPQMMQMMHNTQTIPQRPAITPEMMMSLIRNMSPDMINTLLMQQLSQHQGFNYDFLSQRNEPVDALHNASMLNDLSTDNNKTDTDLIHHLSDDQDEDYSDTETDDNTTSIAVKNGATIWGDPHFVEADAQNDCILIKKYGTIDEAANRDTVKNYEVSTIFDTTFSNFNKFN